VKGIQKIRPGRRKALSSFNLGGIAIGNLDWRYLKAERTNQHLKKKHRMDETYLMDVKKKNTEGIGLSLFVGFWIRKREKQPLCKP